MEYQQQRSRRYGQVYYRESQSLGILSLTQYDGEVRVERWICVQLNANKFDYVEFFVSDGFAVITRSYKSKTVTLLRPFVGVVTDANATKPLIRLASSEYVEIPTTATFLKSGDLVAFAYPEPLLTENVVRLEQSHIASFGQCPICLEEQELFSLTDCQHKLCVECSRQYLLAIYKDLQKYPLCCSAPQCQSLITLNAAGQLLDEIEFRQLETFYCIAAIPQQNRSQCPACGHFMFYGNANPHGQCHKCKLSYCGRCSNTWERHKGKTCEEIRQEDQAALDLQSLALLQRYVQCPQCQTRVEKLGRGCNHMKHDGCPQPYNRGGWTDFCYCCGQLLINARQTPDRERHFPNGMFRDCVNVVPRQ